MIDTDKYETMTQHDLIEIINHWEQLAFQKTNEVKRLREELRLTKEWLHQLYDEELNSAFRYHVYGDDVEVIE
jgi:hypothetical protein